MPHITTDMIVGMGLVAALIISLFTGASSEFQTTVASGLIGYLGRSVLDNRKTGESSASK